MRHLLAAPPPCHVVCSPRRLLAVPPHLATLPARHTAPCRVALPARCAHHARDLGQLDCSPCQTRGSSPSGLLTEPGLLPSSSPCRSSAGSSLCQIGQGALPACHSGGPSFLLATSVTVPPGSQQPRGPPFPISSTVCSHCLD
jgi:hypothetical protein